MKYSKINAPSTGHLTGYFSGESVNSRGRFKESYLDKYSPKDKKEVCKLRKELNLKCENCRYYERCETSKSQSEQSINQEIL